MFRVVGFIVEAWLFAMAGQFFWREGKKVYRAYKARREEEPK